MSTVAAQQQNYQRIAHAIRYLSANQQKQTSLAVLAAHVGVSECHLQRIFTEWAGLSPTQFLQFLTKENAKRLLRSSSVMKTAFACGLSDSSRLTDSMIKTERVMLGEYRPMGADLQIRYGSCASLFGSCFIAVNHRGLCKLAFFDDADDEASLLFELQREWAAATLIRDDSRATAIYEQAFGPVSKSQGLSQKPSQDPSHSLVVLLKGSEFQMHVWEALMAIPVGEVCSYQQLAEFMGMPSSARAVASAIARNNIAYLIPCHRVIRGTGEFCEYRWGADRKRAMLLREHSIGS
ncbi:MAG: AraC family transcriptional regulator of adaptative response [Zhongshania sp.]|jgi:AraC family transcriptional regulator of adaptative response/methylated-DNA-[protein]-cysteine methyltransferase